MRKIARQQALGTGEGSALLPTMVAGVLSSLSFGHIRRRLSPAATFLCGFGFAGAGFVGVGMADRLPLIMLSQAVAGCGIGLLGPNLFGTAALGAAPEQRARNIGIVKGIFAGGPFFGQLALEPIARLASAGAAIIAVGVISVAGLAVSAALIGGLHRRPVDLPVAGLPEEQSPS